MNALLDLPFGRIFGTVSAQFLSNVVPVQRVTATTNGGFVTNFIRLPPDLDVGRPIDIYTTISPAADATTNGQFVALRLDFMHLATDGTRPQGQVNVTWPVPDNWLAAESARVLIDNGSGHTINADVLQPQTWLGCKLQRLGSAGGDDFDKSLDLAQALALGYSSKYPWLINPSLP